MKKAFILLILGMITLSAGQRTPGDLALRNGRIYAMDAARSWAETIVIAHGRIVYIGPDRGAEKWIGKQTKVIDLDGGFVIPSFVDSHVHAVEGGVALNLCHLDEQETKEQILQAISAYVQSHPETPWIVGSGWQLPAFPDANPPKEWLDEIVPDRPAFFMAADGHSAWVNSRALALAGIDKTTRDPENGRIERDSSGEPTGTLREAAAELVSSLIPKTTVEEAVAGLQRALDLMRSFGITGFHDASVSLHGDSPMARGSAAAYQEAERRGLLKARVAASLYANPEDSSDQIQAIKKMQADYQGKYFRPRSVKLFIDGVIEANTATLLEPYLDRPDYSGEANWPAQKLNAFVQQIDREGLQIHMHAIGDRAIRLALDAIENATRANGLRDRRPILAHIELIDRAEVARFAKNGALPCFQPIWAYEDSYIKDLTLPKVGMQRARSIYPMQSVHATGARLCMGSDWNVSSMNPLDGIEVAVTRSDPDGESPSPFFPEERLDLATVLSAYTIGGAYANFWENETGSLEVGKSADLIWLSDNLFEITPSQINRTEVLLTLFEGNIVYQQGGN